MKVTKIILAIAVLLCATLMGCHKGELVEKIPNSEIPDMLFRDYLLLHFDTNLDGFISKKEAKAVKEIDLRDVKAGINFLAGIEYFTSLEKLFLGIMSIERLDLSALSMLEVLDCSGCPLKTLVLPESKRLKSLYGSGSLNSINLNDFELLEDFTFNGTIDKLDIINSSVKRIVCNQIKNLNIGNLPNLEFMSIRNNDNISHLIGNHAVDLTKSTKLKSLTCEYIRCEINISQCTTLEELMLLNVGNKTVDLSKNTAL